MEGWHVRFYSYKKKGGGGGWKGFKDWSLITGRGGGYKTGGGGGGGTWTLTPTKRGGGGGKGLSHAEGGHKKFWGSFYAVAWSFSHIVGGGAKSVHSLKGGGARKVLPCLEGWGRKKFRTRDFPIL